MTVVSSGIKTLSRRKIYKCIYIPHYKVQAVFTTYTRIPNLKLGRKIESGMCTYLQQ